MMSPVTLCCGFAPQHWAQDNVSLDPARFACLHDNGARGVDLAGEKFGGLENIWIALNMRLVWSGSYLLLGGPHVA